MLPSSPDLLFAAASQTIWFDAPEGRPSSVTSVTIYEDASGDTGQTESSITGSASVETNPNTTFDAASGAGQTNPRKCFLTATTGITIGRQYLITNAALGQSEWVEVRGVASADYVLAASPLLHAYASADTFKSTRMTATIDTTWASDISNLSDPWCAFPRYRAAWVYVVSSVTYRAATYFDLVRYPMTYGVTGVDVDGMFPGWLDRLPTDYRVGQGKQVIVQAAKQVKRDLSRIGRTDWAQRNGEAFNELICMQAELFAQRAQFQHGGQNAEQVKAAQDYYRVHFNEWMEASKAPAQTDSSGSGGTPPLAPLFER